MSAIAFVLLLWFSREKPIPQPVPRRLPHPDSTSTSSNELGTRSLRVRVLDHDGMLLSGAGLVLFRRTEAGVSVFSKARSDVGGVANMSLPGLSDSAALSLLVGFWEEKNRALLTEVPIGADASTSPSIDVRFLQESVLDGTLLEEDGKPAKRARVDLNFGWLRGVGDAAYGLSAQVLRNSRNELIQITDDNGCFQFTQVSSLLFVGFYQLSESRRSYRYDVTTSLQPLPGGLYYSVPTPGRYRVVIRRVANPTIKVVLRTGASIDWADSRVRVFVERSKGDPSSCIGRLGTPDGGGALDVPLTLNRGMVPEQLQGNGVFVMAYHPLLGAMYHHGIVDATWVHTVDWYASESGLIEGRIEEEDGSPIADSVLVLQSRLLGSGIAEVQSDANGRFAFRGFGEPPPAWAKAGVEADEFSIEAKVGSRRLLFRETVSAGSKLIQKRTAKAVVKLGAENRVVAIR